MSRIATTAEKRRSDRLSVCHFCTELGCTFLLNNRLQMGCLGANRKVVTQTKQAEISPYEQVRVNYQTAAFGLAASDTPI